MSLIYFSPGDEVTLKQENINAPIMCVKSIKKSILRDDISQDKSKRKPVLQGVICFWFTEFGEYQEQVFNTKDLIKVEN